MLAVAGIRRASAASTSVGVALGVSVARNFIGWDPDGVHLLDYLSTRTRRP